MKRTTCLQLGLWALWLLLLPATASAQSGGDIGDALGALINKGVVNKWLKNEPVTTSIRDADKQVDLPDSFGDGQPFRPMHRRPRTISGGYRLTPGFYELRSRSYCIRAGTHAPSNGDGYLYAPLLGRQADIVATVLTRSALHPDIDQHQVQLLLWAIIARSDFQSMNSELVMATTSLLRPAQMLRLNKQALLSVALSMVDSPQLTAGLRNVFSAEYQIRQAFSQATTSFQDLERLAMLAGPAPVDNPNIRRGRWSKHPDGYYVRYFPAGYSRTVIQVYVPEGITTLEFDTTDDVAVPANTGAQRLALSNVPYDTTGYAPEEPPVIAQQPTPVPPSGPAPPQPAPKTGPLPKPSPPPVYQSLCGQIIDANTGATIADASVSTGVKQLVSDSAGRFELTNLLVGQSVEFVFEAAGYQKDSVLLEIQRLTDCQPLLVNLKPLAVPEITSEPIVLGDSPVREGDRIILENIQFEQSSSKLLPDGQTELDKVVVWMKKHDTVVVELSGHTSNEGERQRNIDLSKQRVNVCKKYLMEKGITASRTKTVGYGPDRPVVPQESAEKARNRRVELKIVRL